MLKYTLLPPPQPYYVLEEPTANLPTIFFTHIPAKFICLPATLR